MSAYLLARLAAVVLGAAALLLAGSPAPRLALLAPLLLWLPGHALLSTSRTISRLGLGARLGAEATLSLPVVALLVELLAALGLAVDVLPPLALAMLAPTVFLRERESMARVAHARFDGFVVGLALLAGVVVAARGATLGPHNDAGMHLALIARAAEAGTSPGSSPFLADPEPWSYADAWHRLLAAAIERPDPGAEEVTAVWHVAGGLVAALRLLAFALLAAECLAPVPAGAALLAWALWPDPALLAFPRAAGVGLLWGGFGLALAALRSRTRKLELGVVTLGAGLALLHPVESLLLALGLVVYGAWRGLLRRDAEPALRPLGLGLLSLLAAVPLVLRGNQRLLGEVAAGALADPSFELLALAHQIWIVDPRFWGFDPSTPLALGAVLAIPLVWRHGTRPGRTLALALVLAAALGLIFPPSAWLVLKLGLPSFFLARAGELFPGALLLGLAVAAHPLLRRPLLLGLLGLALAAPRLVELALTPSPRTQQAIHPLLGPRGAALLGGLPRGSIVLTDPWSADALPAAGGHFTVAGITWHTGTTRDQLAVHDFLASPEQPSGEALELLRRRRVDHVLLTRWKGHPLDWVGYGSSWSTPASGALLTGNPAVFTPAGTTPGLALYRVRRPLRARALAGKDRDPGFVALAPAARSLGRIGAYEVVFTERRGGQVRAVLRAAEATRDCPLVTALALPAGFRETAVAQRLRRVAGGERLAASSGRFAGCFRIDNRFHAPRRIEAGEVIELALPLDAPGEVWIGPDEALPDFPLPLSPALERGFARLPAPR